MKNRIWEKWLSEFSFLDTGSRAKVTWPWSKALEIGEFQAEGFFGGFKGVAR